MEGALITLLAIFFNWFRDQNFSNRSSIGVICLVLIFCYTLVALVILGMDLFKNCNLVKRKA